MKVNLSLVLALIISLPVFSQTDSLLLSLGNEEQTPLLPEKMLFTQRMIWGEKGLARAANLYELTPESRAKELKLRRTMLVTHQVMGFATLAGMVAQGIVGAQLYKNGGHNLKEVHEGLAAAVNATYATTAVMSLFAPPPMISRDKGFTSIRAHKWLAAIHLSGMIATNILADQLENNYKLRPAHRAAAYTTFASFAAAMLVIKL